MLPDPAELKRLSETCTYSDWPFAGVLAAEVIRLRERLATVEGERDEARAGVAELRTKLADSIADHAADLRKAADEFGACIAEERLVTADLQERIDLALQILDDPADESAGICRATEALWGEKPEVPAQIGDDE